MKHVLVAAVFVVAAAAACGGGDGDEDARPTTTEPESTESTAPPTTSLEEGVEADYLAAVAAFERLTTTTNDPNDPELAQRFIDPALSTLRTLLSTDQAEGYVWVTGDLSEHRLDEPVRFQGDGRAVVTDCTIDNNARVPVGTTAVSFPPPVTELGEVTMVERDGRWVVQSIELIDSWNGVSGCAA